MALYYIYLGNVHSDCFGLKQGFLMIGLMFHQNCILSKKILSDEIKNLHDCITSKSEILLHILCKSVIYYKTNDYGNRQ